MERRIAHEHIPNYCDKKALIDQKRPFEGELLSQIKQYYKIGLTWSSNAIEGNTLTISETKVVLEDGLTIGGKPLRDFMETVGHGEAYDYMFSLIGEKSISIDTMKKLHWLFYKGIDETNAGVWRQRDVIVSGTEYVFPAPGKIEEEMERLEAWAKIERGQTHPVDFAALLHLKLVTIHPFIDGNGRAARLIMNLALLQDGHQLAIIHRCAVPNILILSGITNRKAIPVLSRISLPPEFWKRKRKSCGCCILVKTMIRNNKGFRL